MIYAVKRFSQDDEQKKGGMGFGTKALLTAGTVAAGFGAAKTGMLGNTLMRGSNKLWANVGSAVGSRGMVKSGIKGYGTATRNTELSNMAKDAGVKVSELTKQQQAQAAKNATVKLKEGMGEQIGNLKKMNADYVKNNAEQIAKSKKEFMQSDRGKELLAKRDARNAAKVKSDAAKQSIMNEVNGVQTSADSMMAW